eukprot:scaffold128698_cov20-Tisochrysis_lutea.AAC.2
MIIPQFIVCMLPVSSKYPCSTVLDTRTHHQHQHRHQHLTVALICMLSCAAPTVAPPVALEEQGAHQGGQFPESQVDHLIPGSRCPTQILCNKAGGLSGEDYHRVKRSFQSQAIANFLWMSFQSSKHPKYHDWAYVGLRQTSEPHPTTITSYFVPLRGACSLMIFLPVRTSLPYHSVRHNTHISACAPHAMQKEPSDLKDQTLGVIREELQDFIGCPIRSLRWNVAIT